MLKRTGADTGVAEVAVKAAEVVERVQTLSSPGKSSHSPPVPSVQW